MPRLGQIAVDQVLDDLGDEMDLASSFVMLRQIPGAMSYAASGGSPVDKAALADIRSLIIEAAEANGFPKRVSIRDRARFDGDLAIRLGEHDLVRPPEALRDDVWAFLAAVVAPDVVRWRFGKSARERYHGGVRNTFQRLWMRAWSLDRGPEAEDRWGLIRDLTEDAFVQIVERPSIGGDPRIARAFAEGWVRMSEKAGRGAMEAIMRRAVIAFRLRNQIQVLSALDDDQLGLSVDRAFERARQSLESESSSTNRRTEEQTKTSIGVPSDSKQKGSGKFSRIRTLFGRSEPSKIETNGREEQASAPAETDQSATDDKSEDDAEDVSHISESLANRLDEFFDEVASDSKN